MTPTAAHGAPLEAGGGRSGRVCAPRKDKHGDRAAEYARGQARRDARALQRAADVRAADGPGERWVTIADGYYDVSDKGRVRRMKPSYGTNVGHVLRPAMVNGYPRVTIATPTERRQVEVHALVAEAFVGPRPAGYDVNHIDGNKANNRVENLEYVTRTGNMQHAGKMGLLRSKLTVEAVRAIREARAAGESEAALSARFNISRPQLNKIVRRISWRHVA